MKKSEGRNASPGIVVAITDNPERNMKRLLITLLLIGAAMQPACGQEADKAKMTEMEMKGQNSRMNGQEMQQEEAVLGAGCFWCVEAVFEQLDGVLSVEAGYAGGKSTNPSYEEVCSGNTGHVEVAKIVFDASIISYAEILDMFWRAHDPTTENRQGNDVGSQYRSVIFYANEKQHEAARASRKHAAQLYSDAIVTGIEPLPEFYLAEDYHQDYYRNNSEAPYCSFVIKSKLRKLGLKE